MKGFIRLDSISVLNCKLFLDWKIFISFEALTTIRLFTEGFEVKFGASEVLAAQCSTG